MTSTPQPPAPSRPLDGIRVIEMGQLLAGPFCGTLLAYYGAEVIKVEPRTGDPIRTWRETRDGVSFWWYSIGRNKKSITIDLKSERGRELAKQLISTADVLLEKLPAGHAREVGYVSRHTSRVEPEAHRVAHLRLRPKPAPMPPRPGYASVCEGFGGLRYINGFPGERPVRPNLSLGDSLGGLHAAFGILLALVERQRSRLGQDVDVALFESVYNMMEAVVPEYDGAGVVREPSGSTLTGIVPTNTYACKDGRYVIIGGNGESIYQRLMRAAGRPEMADDPKYAGNENRVVHEQEIDDALAAWTASLDLEDVLDILREAKRAFGADLQRARHDGRPPVPGPRALRRGRCRWEAAQDPGHRAETHPHARPDRLGRPETRPTQPRDLRRARPQRCRDRELERRGGHLAPWQSRARSPPTSDAEPPEGWPAAVELIEVGPRDGFQMEEQFIPTELKVEMIEQLARAGIREIEAVSFVHPRVIPQMRDADDVMRQLDLPKGHDVTIWALVPNLRGAERALAAGVDGIHQVICCTETYNQKNVGLSVDDSVAQLRQVVELSEQSDHPVATTATMAATFGCPFEGQVEDQRLVELARRFADTGIDHLGLADSAGLGHPLLIDRVVANVRAALPEIPLRMHLHDTRGAGVANAVAALAHGVSRFDTSFGGLGGCPIMRGASGNLATEDFNNLCLEMNLQTGVSTEAVAGRPSACRPFSVATFRVECSPPGPAKSSTKPTARAEPPTQILGSRTSARLGRDPLEIDPLRSVIDRVEKLEKPIPRHRRRHRIDQRVHVQGLLLEGATVEQHLHHALAIVDHRETASPSPGSTPRWRLSRSALANEKRPDPTCCAKPRRSTRMSSRQQSSHILPFLLRRKRFFVCTPVSFRAATSPPRP